MTTKITRTQLREMIKEALYKEMYNLAAGQKKLSEKIQFVVTKAPLKEYKQINSKNSLLEFIGPFKKFSTEDLSSMPNQKEVKQLFSIAKEAEKARKELSTVKVTNLNALDEALTKYVDKLIALWNGIRIAEVTGNVKGQLSKPFATAIYTLKSISEILSDASNELFASVPKSTGVYSAGKEQHEIEDVLAATKKTPKQIAKDLLDVSTSGRSINK